MVINYPQRKIRCLRTTHELKVIEVQGENVCCVCGSQRRGCVTFAVPSQDISTVSSYAKNTLEHSNYLNIVAVHQTNADKLLFNFF